jgi:hypothetical protein
MNSFYTVFRLALPVLCATGLFAAQAPAMPLAPGVTLSDSAGLVMTVASDCYAVGQQVAAQKGGTLAKASQSTQGGQPVCVIVVLVPGKEGERPRRSEIVVPQN